MVKKVIFIDIEKLIREQFNTEIDDVLMNISTVNLDELKDAFLNDVIMRFFVRLLNDMIWTKDEKHGRTIINHIACNNFFQNFNRDKYQATVDSFSEYYGDKPIIDSEAIKKIKRRTPWVLLPVYDFIIRKTNEPVFKLVLNKNNKVKIHKLTINGNIDTQFSIFFNVLNDYEKIVNRPYNKSVNFYLFAKKTKLLIANKLAAKMDHNLETHIQVNRINFSKDRKYVEQIKNVQSKILFNMLETIAIKQISKFPLLYIKVMERIPKDALTQCNLYYWNLLQRPIWKKINNLAKKILRYVDIIIYTSSLEKKNLDEKVKHSKKSKAKRPKGKKKRKSRSSKNKENKTSTAKKSKSSIFIKDVEVKDRIIHLIDILYDKEYYLHIIEELEEGKLINQISETSLIYKKISWILENGSKSNYGNYKEEKNKKHIPQD